MRILAFSDHLSSASSGGAERVAGEIYRRIACESGVSLTVVTVLRPGHPPMDIPGAEVIPVTGKDLSGLVGVEMLLASGLGRQARAMQDRARPDVLHANGLHFQGSAVAARLASRSGTPLVTTAHLGDLSALSRRLRASGTVWDHTIGRGIVKASSAMVAVSQAVAEHLSTIGADPVSTVVAPNGVDHDTYHARDRRQVGSDGPLRAVFIGRLIENKGPDVALAAVASARAAGSDVKLSVLGDGPMREKLEASARRFGIEDDVSFAGHVDGVAAHLRDADVLLRPSYTEGLPLAVLEAMACGVPVVCSTVPGNTEVVKHGQNGLHTPPGGVAEVAESLSSLDRNRDLLRRLAGTATATAQDYSWARSAAIHLDTFRAARRDSAA